ncbi:MAG: carboxypeptidase-like regulatory domain-containing protein [Clostridium sp.]
MRRGSSHSMFSDSSNIEMNNNNNIKLNIGMCKNEDQIKTAVLGRVTSRSSQPVKGAIVKIVDSNNNSISMAKCDKNGNYFIQGFPSNEELYIFAVIHNKTVSDIINFQVSDEGYKTLNILITKPITMDSSIIVGDISSSGDGSPINGVAITIYRIRGNRPEINGLVYTNEFGQFAFREIDIGRYNLQFNANGFRSRLLPLMIKRRGVIKELDIKLIPDNTSPLGTISGVIVDEYNRPIPDADVILHKKVIDGSGTVKHSPIAFTKTNKRGVYIFINIPEGNYKIHSNKVAYNI